VAKALDSVWVFGLFYIQPFIYLCALSKKFLCTLIDIRSVLRNSYIHLSLNVGWDSSGWNNFPMSHSGCNVNGVPPPFRHVELALYADDTAVIATFC